MHIDMWHNMFALGLPWAEKVLRPVFVYAFPHHRAPARRDPDILIEDGVLKEDCLRKEAITVTEILGAARKHGFASPAEIDRGVLEPRGSIAFFGKKPAPELARHAEIINRLEALTAQLAALKA